MGRRGELRAPVCGTPVADCWEIGTGRLHLHLKRTASHVLELVGVFGALLKADEGENGTWGAVDVLGIGTDHQLAPLALSPPCRCFRVADRRKRRRTGDPGSPSEAGTPPSTTAPLGQPAGASSFMEVGSQVAIRPMDQDWQLAIVVGVKQGEAGKWKYEVEDVDVDEVTGQRRRYVFPVKACVEVKVHRPEMPQATEVLALYPGTTCFYTAHVVNPPSRTRRASYIVQFEDDNGQHREVESKFVLPIPAKVRLKK